jgi:hypothetical protein
MHFWSWRCFVSWFNHKYLTGSLNAVLNATKENQVELYFMDTSLPVLLKKLLSSEDVFVIIPVKVWCLGWVYCTGIKLFNNIPPTIKGLSHNIKSLSQH